MSLFSSLTGWTWDQVIAGFATKFSYFMSTRLGKWITAALGAIGIDLTVYDQVIAPWIEQARTHWSGIGADVMTWLTWLRLDECLTIVLSAYGIAGLKRIFFRKKS